MSIEFELAELLKKMYNNGGDYKECASASAIYQKYKSSQFNSKPAKINGFFVKQDEQIPKLSWICEIKNREYHFTVGESVEYGDNFILEGVWPGDYKDLNFYMSDHFYGSGAFVDKNNILRFVPPRVCTDYLYVLHDKIKNITYVSNSFNFIFKRINLDLDSAFYFDFKNNLHNSTALESREGADGGSPVIVETSLYAMYRMMYHNFTIGDNGKINYRMRVPYEVKIKDFESYKKFLIDITKRIIKNAEDDGRKHRLESITMCSTGYDSSAVTAICAQSGVKDAITLEVITRGHDDCGEKIARLLNLNCIKVDHYWGKIVKKLPHAASIDNNEELLEFVATPGIGDNVAFYNMASHFENKIVFSGLYGDGCWSKEGGHSGLAHGLPYMKSRNEFRLRVGYYLIPMPAFGAFFSDKLRKITKHKSMEAYTLNNDYDRPIPRRICEEAGIPRELFGMKKAANNSKVINFKDIFDDAVKYVMKRYS